VESILGTLLGAVLAICTTIVIERTRQPMLELSIKAPVDNPYGDKMPARSARFLGVEISNQRLPSLFRWMDRSPANQCRGEIGFHHLDGQPVFDETMVARWTGTREPRHPEIYVPDPSGSNGYKKYGTIFDVERLELVQSLDIHVGSPKAIDIAARFDEEDESYGWSNESYFSEKKWRPEKWRMGKQIYLVRVTIHSSGRAGEGLFRLVNDTGISSFRLLAASRDDRKKIESWKNAT